MGKSKRVFLSSDQFSFIIEVFTYNGFLFVCLFYTVISFTSEEVIPGNNRYILSLDNKLELESAFLVYEENRRRGFRMILRYAIPTCCLPILGIYNQWELSINIYLLHDDKMAPVCS